MEPRQVRAHGQCGWVNIRDVCVLLVFLAAYNADRSQVVQLGRSDVHDAYRYQRDGLSFRGTTEVCGPRSSGAESSGFRPGVRATYLDLNENIYNIYTSSQEAQCASL